ncbi:MAG TPA: hypothetical protein VFW85_07815 [Gaiellaceae bacterium]|nr:hypothetical protein [Gaiellaceae bacterium]
MKRLLAVIVGGFGLRVLLRRRLRAAAVPEPADELRAKLAETRSDEPEASANGAASNDSVDSRRADVHDRARRAIDELRD